MHHGGRYRHKYDNVRVMRYQLAAMKLCLLVVKTRQLRVF